MAEFKQKVGPFEVFASSTQVGSMVSVYVTCGEHCDVNLYVSSNDARKLADLLKRAADVADK